MKAANYDMGYERYKMDNNSFLTRARAFCREYIMQSLPGGRPPKVTQKYPGFVPKQPLANPGDNHQRDREILSENLNRGFASLGMLNPCLGKSLGPQGTLYYAVLGCTKLYWAILIDPGLYWAVLGCTGMYLAELGCPGLYWTGVGCTGL